MLHLSVQRVRHMCRAGMLGTREGGEWVIYRWEVAARLGATPADVEQIKRLDIAATMGEETPSLLSVLGAA